MFNFPKAFTGLLFFACFLLVTSPLIAQFRWVKVDSGYGPMPAGLSLYQSEGQYNGKPFRAFYAEAELGNRSLLFSNDTSENRRLTPSQFYEKLGHPALVVNTSFFSFQTNRNLNLVLNRKKILAYNIQTIRARGKDSLMYHHPYGSALGIRRNRTADIAWTYTDSSRKYVYALQLPVAAPKDSFPTFTKQRADEYSRIVSHKYNGRQLRKWRMQTALGGGPVLLQNGRIRITNNEEMKFAGKAINDAHPRTGIGYTKDGKLIVMVVEGRNPGIAAGATLSEFAELFLSLGCEEAMNLDGGGSSTMLINGKETIRPSDKGGQRAVPAVFVVKGE